MARITSTFIAEQIEYLRTDREFYIEYDEFGGDETDLPQLRLLLRRAATAAGLRVHTRAEGDALWVFDPDWHPTGDELAQRRRHQDEAVRAWQATQEEETLRVLERRHLRPLN